MIPPPGWKSVMNVYCYYCGTHYESKDGRGNTSDSHGICHSCFAEKWEEA